jgi:hypothetical protein
MAGFTSVTSMINPRPPRDARRLSPIDDQETSEVGDLPAFLERHECCNVGVARPLRHGRVVVALAAPPSERRSCPHRTTPAYRFQQAPEYRALMLAVQTRQ